MITHVLNGTVTQTTTFSYDNDGNVTTELTEHFDPNTGLFTGSTERIDNDPNTKGHTKITKDVDGRELTRTQESDEIEVC